MGHRTGLYGYGKSRHPPRLDHRTPHPVAIHYTHLVLVVVVVVAVVRVAMGSIMDHSDTSIITVPVHHVTGFMGLWE